MDNNLEEMFSMYLGMNTNEEIINNKFTSFVVKHNKIDLSNFGSKLYFTGLVHNLCVQYLFSDIYYIILKSNLEVLYNKKFIFPKTDKFLSIFVIFFLIILILFLIFSFLFFSIFFLEFSTIFPDLLSI